MKAAIQTIVLAILISGCNQVPTSHTGATAQSPAGPGFPFDAVVDNVRTGMTVQKARELTGFTFPANGRFHTDRLSEEAFCTVVISNGIFQTIQTGHNGVCHTLVKP